MAKQEQSLSAYLVKLSECFCLMVSQAQCLGHLMTTVGLDMWETA